MKQLTVREWFDLVATTHQKRCSEVDNLLCDRCPFYVTTANLGENRTGNCNCLLLYFADGTKYDFNSQAKWFELKNIYANIELIEKL